MIRAKRNLGIRSIAVAVVVKYHQCASISRSLIVWIAGKIRWIHKPLVMVRVVMGGLCRQQNPALLRLWWLVWRAMMEDCRCGIATKICLMRPGSLCARCSTLETTPVVFSSLLNSYCIQWFTLHSTGTGGREAGQGILHFCHAPESLCSSSVLF